MKRHVCTLLTCLLIVSKLRSSAQVKPCMALINTGKEVFKGVLYQVTPDSIGVKGDTSLVFFKPGEIKNIKIKEIKGFEYKKYLNYEPKSYDKFSTKMVPVRKWGEKDPTIEEELSGRIITSFYNTALNSLTSSWGFMNKSLANIKINYDERIYKEEFKDLTYRSLAYQLDPEHNASAPEELRAAISIKDN